MIYRILMLMFLAVLPALTQAQTTLPAFYDVTNVASNDVLNIRAAPNASSAILGHFPPNARKIEVISITGKWALINAGEGTGYIAARFLRRVAGPDWTAMRMPLTCSGNEPFWSLGLAAGNAQFSTPDTAPAKLKATANGTTVILAGRTISGTAKLRARACSDGMSDRAYGISLSMTLRQNGKDQAYSGCCRLSK